MGNLTRSKFVITIDLESIKERHTRNADAIKEVTAALRAFCDRAESYGLGGNIVTQEGQIIGKAHVTRPRHQKEGAV